MELLKIFGERDPSLALRRRESVRAILVNSDGTLHMVSSRFYFDCCFPGGGKETDESDLDALRREVREETGYEIDPASVTPFGQVELFFPDKYHERTQLHQINRYYICRGKKVCEPSLSESEKDEDLFSLDISVEDAIACNASLTERGLHWIERELFVLRALRKDRKIFEIYKNNEVNIMTADNKTIAIACDHGGFVLKAAVVARLEEKGYTVRDFGAYTAERVEYPDVAEPACRAVVAGEARFAVLICGTGIGMSLVANKIHGIRAACCSESYSARLTRQHNDANVLCFGARVIGEATALELVDAFLDTEFEGGRHAARVAKIAEIEARG